MFDGRVGHLDHPFSSAHFKAGEKLYNTDIMSNILLRISDFMAL